MSLIDVTPTSLPIQSWPTPAPPPSATGFLARLGAEDRGALIAGRRAETFAIGDTIWGGATLGGVAIMARGAAALLTTDGDGVDAGSGLALGGDSPGLADALSRDGGDSEDDRGGAVLPSTAIRVSPNALRRLWRDSPSFRDAAVTQMAMESACARRWCVCQTRHGVDERVSGLLLRLHNASDGAPLRTTQELLSAVLGVQRTTISQSASKLQNVGVVNWRRGAVDVLDAGRLARFACDCADEERELRAAYG